MYSIVNFYHQDRLTYIIGRNFCYEDVDSLTDHGTSVRCQLANDPYPPPVFNMTLTRALVNGSVEVLLTSPTGDLLVNTSLLALLFEESTLVLNVKCIVSNHFGEGSATSTIRVCGTYPTYTVSLHAMLKL